MTKTAETEKCLRRTNSLFSPNNSLFSFSISQRVGELMEWVFLDFFWVEIYETLARVV